MKAQWRTSRKQTNGDQPIYLRAIYQLVDDLDYCVWDFQLDALPIAMTEIRDYQPCAIVEIAEAANDLGSAQAIALTGETPEGISIVWRLHERDETD